MATVRVIQHTTASISTMAATLRATIEGLKSAAIFDRFCGGSCSGASHM